jgi:putative transposase
MRAVIQAYRFALDPTPEQDAALPSHCGAQRYAYNWGLGSLRVSLVLAEASSPSPGRTAMTV